MRHFHTWFLHLPPPLAYALVFGILVVEGVGLPGVPFEPFFFATGALIATGRLLFWPVVLAGAAGNVLGNLIGYGVAAWAGRLLRAWVLRRGWLTPERLEAGEQWVRRLGGRALFVGRWFGPIRTPAILASGMVRLPLLDYLAWSALAALSWTATWQFLAWRFGTAAAGLWTTFGFSLVGVALVSIGVTVLIVRAVRGSGPESEALAWARRGVGRVVASYTAQGGVMGASDAGSGRSDASVGANAEGEGTAASGISAAGAPGAGSTHRHGEERAGAGRGTAGGRMHPEPEAAAGAGGGMHPEAEERAVAGGGTAGDAVHPEAEERGAGRRRPSTRSGGPWAKGQADVDATQAKAAGQDGERPLGGAPR